MMQHSTLLSQIHRTEKYMYHNEWWENKYVPGEPEGTLTVEYLLDPGYKHLHNCKTNQTALIRKLMEVQRNGQ